MNKLPAFPFVLAALALLAVANSAPAQPFAIDWHTIAGGGGTSSGGTFKVSGTIGQPDANPQPMAGGTFSLTGGFWSLVAVQTEGAPLLSITQQGTAVRVFWPLTALDFVLDQSPATTGTWSQVSFPYVTNTTDISFSTPAPTGNKFYRLRKP